VNEIETTTRMAEPCAGCGGAGCVPDGPSRYIKCHDCEGVGDQAVAA
jgi:hypothetical protein